MAPRLHELLAVQGQLRQQAEATRNDLMNTFEKKRTHFSEIIITFNSNKENVDPKEESKMGVQTTVHKELRWVGDYIAKAIDAAHSVDVANMSARADIALEDGKVILKAVPATSLLQLEKRLEEVQRLVKTIPTLDPAKGFLADPQRGEDYFKARDVEKPRTEKTYKPLILAPATDKHPAQVEKITVDEVIGHTIQQEWSSLITVSEKGDMLDRVESLIRAVKRARSRANDDEINVADNKIGMTLLDYVFWGK